MQKAMAESFTRMMNASVEPIPVIGVFGGGYDNSQTLPKPEKKPDLL